MYADDPADLSPFPDTESLKFVSESNYQNILRFKFGEITGIPITLEIYNVYEAASIEFKTYFDYYAFIYSNKTDQVYQSEEFMLGSESPEHARLNSWGEQHIYIG